MADYARRPNAAHDTRTLSESNRRLRTRRPRAGHAPSPAWVMEGEINSDRFFPRAPVRINPSGNEDYPEFKAIVGFEGFLESGSVVIDWWANYAATYEAIYEGHTIDASNAVNRVLLDVSYIVDGAMSGRGVWIQPRLSSIDTGSMHLSCVYLVEIDPT